VASRHPALTEETENGMRMKTTDDLLAGGPPNAAIANQMQAGRRLHRERPDERVPRRRRRASRCRLLTTSTIDDRDLAVHDGTLTARRGSLSSRRGVGAGLDGAP